VRSGADLGDGGCGGDADKDRADALAHKHAAAGSAGETLAVRSKYRNLASVNITLVNPLQPEVFGVKFSLREIGRIFFIKIRNFMIWKMPKQKQKILF